MLVGELPPLDGRTLLILQAGHVSTGAFDPLEPLCAAAKKAGSWVHVDGAFGLWAAASSSHRYLSEERDGMLTTPDMSRRARGIDLWATLKSLGRSGVAELVDRLCGNALLFEEGLRTEGFTLLNRVCFNQVLVCCQTPRLTQATLEGVQASGECWCGGTLWNGEPAIRISVCSHVTTGKDVERSVAAFVKARAAARAD